MALARVFLVLGLAAFPLAALNPNLRLSQLQLDSWGAGSGLPQNSVLSVLQTRDGYLWLGMRNDLLRFDGVRFVGVTDPEAFRFGRSFVLHLFQDRSGRFWACSWGSGLLLMDHGSVRRFTEADGLGSNRVRFAMESRRDGLLVGTNNGVFRMRRDRFQPYAPAVLKGLDVKSIFQDRRGRLWIGTMSGLFADDGRGESALHPVGAAAAERVWALGEDSGGEVWMGTESGLFRLRAGRPDELNRVEGIPETQVRSLLFDASGSIWIGTARGLARIGHGEVEWLRSGDGLLAEYVTGLALDREGSLWIASDGGGLNRLREEKFTFVSRREGLTHDMARAICAAPQGDVWIGTERGLNRLRDGALTAPIPPLKEKDVRSLMFDRDGRLWISTADDGLYTWENGTLRHPVSRSDLAGETVRALFQDSRKRIWIGSSGGVWQLIEGRPLRLPGFSVLSGYETLFFEEDRNGLLWVGTDRGVATIRDGQAVMRVSDLPVKCLLRDRQDRIWLGTASGLSLLDGGRLYSFANSDGMFEYEIYAILEDDASQLWLTTENGIWKVPTSELLERARGGTRFVDPTLFSEKDGLKSIVCNGSGQASGCRDAGGRFWFPLAGGVATIRPTARSANPLPPPLNIEEIAADDVRLESSRPVSLAAGTRRLTVRYTALSFIAPERIRFRVKLDGFDRSWREVGGERLATFTNLPPGNYAFRVTACNSDGVWNPEGASLAFSVRSFVYQRSWFMVLALLLFGGASYGIVHYVRDYMRVHAFWKKKSYIGHFKLLEVIGTGGMGTVYKALDLLGDNRVVALKVLKEENFASEAHKKRFRNEAAVIDQLEHPNIVQILERGQTDEHLYIAMELVEGMTLARRIREIGPLPLGEALEIMSQMAAALERIHGHAIVHRDLKPENIIVNTAVRPVRVKLLDFGLAINPAHSRLTESGIVIGTLHYMPPERLAKGDSALPGDVYSLGMIFYEMLTATKPFAADDTLDVVNKILNDSPPSLEEKRPDLPAALRGLIARMIEKDPDYRPPIGEVIRQLLMVIALLKTG